jgi:pyruvate dehydrogenase E2 component (dihydrolipoamide acetyltransferase)
MSEGTREVENPMTTKVTMPQMGESISEGILTRWLKKVGDTVNRDEPLFEISTDKVDSEIPSPASGVLIEILVPEGKTVQINTVLAIINGKEMNERPPLIQEAATTGQAPREHHRETQTKTQEPAVPQPAGMLELERAPAVPEIDRQTAAVPRADLQEIRTSPLVRKLARENNVDLSDIRGSGLEGRITKDDILNYIARHSSSQISKAPPPSGGHIPSELSGGVAKVVAAAGVSQFTEAEQFIPAESLETAASRFSGESETLPMTAMRKAIAEHMVLSKRTSAHVNTVFEVDMSSIVVLREQQKSEFEKREGVPLTYTPFFAKALVDTVREFPSFNSSISGDNIVFKKSINLGIAVALDSGLIVPVIKDAHLRSFTGLALQVDDLAKRARTKKLRPDDVLNGTITLTNPGSYGALFSTPIINQPQVAILGVGGIEKRPVVVNDAIAIRSMVCLSLSFDHRVIDGADADRFMVRLKHKLQSWSQWID